MSRHVNCMKCGKDIKSSAAIFFLNNQAKIKIEGKQVLSLFVYNKFVILKDNINQTCHSYLIRPPWRRPDWPLDSCCCRWGIIKLKSYFMKRASEFTEAIKCFIFVCISSWPPEDPFHHLLYCFPNLMQLLLLLLLLLTAMIQVKRKSCILETKLATSIA